VAIRYGRRFRAAFRHLIDFPETGARRPRFHLDMRIWVIAPYVIFYRFNSAEQIIHLARIVHSRRDLTPGQF
jgi:plasmid stabilization system protein ParE